jgi:iron complex outermembrane receptor protein
VDSYTKVVLSFCLICLGNIILYGQITIDSIVISDTKAVIFKNQVPDYQSNDSTVFSNQEFLQKILSGQLQLNTPGGLMTLLHRGMGNRHLPVLWQGVNLQSIINGSYDLGLIPIGLLDDISFYSVGSPTLQGNNGFAGALNIKDGLSRQASALKFYLLSSSLENYSLGLKNTINRSKWSSNIGIELGQDNNRFSFIYNQKKEKRVSTEFEKINVVMDVEYYLSPRSYISTNIWWQSASRMIPVSTSSAPKEQKQADENFRSQLSYLYFTNKHRIKTSISFMTERLDFKSSDTAPDGSNAKVDIFLISAEWSQIKNKDYSIGLTQRNDVASPNFYPVIQKRFTSQLSLSRKIKWSSSWMSDLSMRQDLVDQKWMPISWTIHTLHKNTAFLLARNYNLPGFNDLYWPSGGNPNLKTEKSIQAELKSKISWKGLVLKFATYGQIVDDWIQWIPQTSGIWSPSNQRRVFSRGLEMNVGKQKYWQSINWEYNASYSFNKTTSIAHYTDPALIGKQLIYIPMHKVGISLGANYKGHLGKIHYTYTGPRFDTPDESQSLAPIHLVNLNYSKMYGKTHFMLGVNNILNHNYQYVRFFPLPGINAEFKVIYKVY